MQAEERRWAPTQTFILHARNRADLTNKTRPIPQHPFEDLAALHSLGPVLFLGAGATVCCYFFMREYGAIGVAATVAFSIALVGGLALGVGKGLRKRARRERLFAQGQFLPGGVVCSCVSDSYSQSCWEATPEVVGRLLTVRYHFVTPSGREIHGAAQGELSEQPLPGTPVTVLYLGEDDYELL